MSNAGPGSFLQEFNPVTSKPEIINMGIKFFNFLYMLIYSKKVYLKNKKPADQADFFIILF
jgi:hypothetical protein